MEKKAGKQRVRKPRKVDPRMEGVNRLMKRLEKVEVAGQKLLIGMEELDGMIADLRGAVVDVTIEVMSPRGGEEREDA